MLNRLEKEASGRSRDHRHSSPLPEADAYALIRVAPVDTELVMNSGWNQRVDPVAVADDDITSAQLLHPPKFSVLVPVCPVKLMTSPGFIDLSISSTNPLTKLLAMDCRRSPAPRPIAPVNTFKVVTSTPAALMPSMMPRPTSRKYVNFEMPIRVPTASDRAS